MAALKLLKESHLVEIGVPLGPRAKILHALKQMEALETNALPSSTQSPSTSVNTSPEGQSSPQRTTPRLGESERTTSSSLSSSMSSASSAADLVPKAFICPLTGQLMSFPASLEDGTCYEQAAIERWLLSNSTSPVTSIKLTSKDARPNLALRALIQEWKSAHPNAKLTSQVVSFAQPQSDALFSWTSSSNTSNSSTVSSLSLSGSLFGLDASRSQTSVSVNLGAIGSGTGSGSASNAQSRFDPFGAYSRIFGSSSGSDNSAASQWPATNNSSSS